MGKCNRRNAQQAAWSLRALIRSEGMFSDSIYAAKGRLYTPKSLQRRACSDTRGVCSQFSRYYFTGEQGIYPVITFMELQDVDLGSAPWPQHLRLRRKTSAETNHEKETLRRLKILLLMGQMLHTHISDNCLQGTKWYDKMGKKWFFNLPNYRIINTKIMMYDSVSKSTNAMPVYIGM